tara:strand:+ start:172 stop:324 length:153 start_codon:yes stop_codon:yes gene_type:complete
MEIRKGVHVIVKIMNHIALINEKIKRVKRLSGYKLLVTKNEDSINYEPTI